VIPKTSKKERLTENIGLFDFSLSSAEMKLITNLNQNRKFNDPGNFAEAAFNTFCPIYE
jgi:D-xylose reductase